MKQYIKKALWIIPFVFSLNLSAATYYFVFTKSNDNGADMDNWSTSTVTGAGTKPSLSDFEVAGNVFDVWGYDVDFAGLTLGNINITNSDIVYQSNITNSGIINVTSSTPPSVTIGVIGSTVPSGVSWGSGDPNIINKFNLSGSINYIASASQSIADWSYFRITLKGGLKKVDINTINIFDSITLLSNCSLEISKPVALGSSAALFFQNSSHIYYKIGGSLYDPRASRIYGGTVYLDIPFTSSASVTNTPSYNRGTYNNLNVLRNAKFTADTGRLFKITGTLTLNTANTFLYLYDSTAGTAGTKGSPGTPGTETGVSIEIAGSISGSNGQFSSARSSRMTISSGTSNSLYFRSNINFLRSLNVTNSSTITVSNTLNFSSGTSYGTLVVDTLSTCSTGNNLVFLSTAAGTARIGKSSGRIIGEYTVEQYIPSDRDYRFISAPVVNGTALQLRDNKGSTSGRGIQITGNNPSATTGNDFDASTLNNPSAYYYAQDSAGDITTVSKIAGATDDPGWRPFWNGNTFKLINGKGYRVFVRGDRSINLNQSGQSSKATTIWTKGTYPGYSVNIPVQNSGRSKTNNGINLVGNPYPSVIDWNLIQKSNIDSGYMVYKNSNQSFVGWNGVTGSAGQYISAYQGFLVKCTNSSGSGSITIHERTKTVQTGGSFFQQKLTNHLKITMTYDSSYNSDAYLHFRNDAKNTYDGNDIQQMLNNGTNVATLDDAGMPYNINSMGTLDSFKSIPLSVEGTPAADLKLSFYDIASFSTHKLELIDNYLKKTTPIAEAMDYAFSITSDSWSYKNGRFFINLTKQETASNKIVQTEKLGILHPNPIKDKINITLEKNATNGKYQIVNSIGQEIMSGDIVGKSKTIDAKNLSTGIYYLNILSNGTSQNIKFIK